MQHPKQALAALCAWYRANARPLPWRCDPPDPYRVWISEVMLQQTRIEAVIPYFERFIGELPDVAALAAVADDRLMKLWEGLGYYNRARNLKKAAAQILAAHGGEVPHDYAALHALPGFGDYTAGAVASIAFDLPVPAVDGNVLRVWARLHADFEDITRPAVKKRVSAAIAALLPKTSAGMCNAALMELGERVCLPNTAPRCEECPLTAFCEGRVQDVAAMLPVRSPRRARRVEDYTVLLLVSKEPTPRVLLHRRAPKGLLAGLWELPMVPGGYSYDAAVAATAALGATPQDGLMTGKGRHLFTHIEWRMTGVRFLTPRFAPPPDYEWASLSQIFEEMALPSAFQTFRQVLPVFLQPNRKE